MPRWMASRRRRRRWTRARPSSSSWRATSADAAETTSGPRGFVLVTRGAVMACQNEEELAGILSHEIAHSARKHAEKVLRQSKSFGNALGGVLKIAGDVTGVDDTRWGSALVDFFSKSV